MDTIDTIKLYTYCAIILIGGLVWFVSEIYKSKKDNTSVNGETTLFGIGIPLISSVMIMFYVKNGDQLTCKRAVTINFAVLGVGIAVRNFVTTRERNE